MNRALAVSRLLSVSDRLYDAPGLGRVRLVLDGYEGSFMAVAEATGDCLLRRELPPVSADELRLLQDSHVLVDACADELDALIRRNKAALQDHSVATYTILPSSHCNMGCDYCGQSHAKGAMSAELEQAVLRRIGERMARPETRHVHVNWFGAEPMMAYPTILRLAAGLQRLAEASGVALSARMISNGTLLTADRLWQLCRCGIDTYEVTLDGPPAIHDARRPLKSGKPNFALIVGLIRAALDEPRLAAVRFGIRINVDARNCAAVESLLDLMKAHGLDHPRVVFSFHAVHPWSNDVSGIALGRERYALLEIDWMLAMLARGLHFESLPNRARTSVCGAVRSDAEVIGTGGEIYSCTEHPLVPMHQRRDVLAWVQNAAASRPSGAFDDFNDKVLRGETPCHGCRHFGLCGGACPKHWAEGHVPCPSFKLNMQGRFDVAALMNGFRPLAPSNAGRGPATQETGDAGDAGRRHSQTIP